MFTGSELEGKRNFLGAKNIPFRANGLLTFSMVYCALKKEEKKNNQNNKSNKTCTITISLLQQLTFCL